MEKNQRVNNLFLEISFRRDQYERSYDTLKYVLSEEALLESQL